MSISIKHLNADTSFLLELFPTHPSETSSRSAQGFSILIDPWLDGPSTVLHPKFANITHKFPSCISSLREIPEPDLVVISQSQPDHCHRKTLCQLPSNSSKTLILADPGAARSIKGWKHFAPSCIQSLEKYDRRRPTSVRRIPIPAPSKDGLAGEVSIALIVKKFDPAGVHSALGITYAPPLSSQEAAIHTKRNQDLPLSPPPSPGTPFSSDSICPDLKTFSILYSPHGVSYIDIKDYVDINLRPRGAIPLDALLHSFSRVHNPWWLGGNLNTGMPGGLEITRYLHPRVWISAHDEDKDKKGISVKKTRVQQFQAEEIQRQIDNEAGEHHTEVRVLAIGEAMKL